jgi:hypothetical protein
MRDCIVARRCGVLIGSLLDSVYDATNRAFFDTKVPELKVGPPSTLNMPFAPNATAGGDLPIASCFFPSDNRPATNTRGRSSRGGKRQRLQEFAGPSTI